MRLTSLLTIPVAAFLAAAVSAQTLPSGVRKGPSVEGITEYVYPNGLRVLLFPDASAPKVTVNMTILVGSRHEGYGETGMAHLLEHMLFMKTTNGRDIKKELTDHGASWNGTTDYDRTNYFETVPATDDNLRWALELESDRMVNSRLEKAMLDTEMTVVRNEFERGENNATSVLEERVLSAAYLWHNYGKSVIGTRADIEHVPIDRLAAFYKKYYQPDNSMVVVAGQFNPDKALAEIAATFGKIPLPARTLDTPYTIEPTQDGERYVALRRVGNGQSLIVAYHSPAGGHPDAAALEVLAGVMTGSSAGGRGGRGGAGDGRLYRALVENGKATSARMSSVQMHDPGFVLTTVQLSKEQSLAEARQILLQTVEGLVKEPPTREEVERVKTRLVRSLENRMENTQSVALNLSEWAAMGDWRILFYFRDLIKKVTPEDVTRVAKQYLIESNRTIGEFIPTPAPVRAEIPAVPDYAATLRDYKGGEAMQEGEAFDPTPANVEARLIRKKLAGGLKVVMLPKKMRGATVSLVLELHWGDEKSLVGQNVASQFASSLLMRGTKNKTRQQIQDEMDRLKARISVTGGNATITTTAENLDASLRLVAEILKEPLLPEKDFNQARQQRIDALERTRTEPNSLAAEQLQRHMSPFAKGDPRYVGTIDERIDELKKVTLDDVKRFHARFYGASEGEMVVVGQFDQAQLLKTAGELFDNWKSASPYKRLTTPYKKVQPINTKVETPDKENAIFEAGLPVQMKEDDPDFPAMMVANYMFGGTLGSRMPNRIRNVEGLSYSVRSGFSAPYLGDGGRFSASAISAPQNTPKVEASFRDELLKTLREGFTEQELVTAKKAIRDQQLLTRSSDQALLRTIATRESTGRTLKWDEELEAKIQAVTVAQVNAAFRKYIDPAAISIVKAGDFKKAGAFQ